MWGQMRDAQRQVLLDSGLPACGPVAHARQAGHGKQGLQVKTGKRIANNANEVGIGYGAF